MFSNLNTLTRGLALKDTDRIFAQGYAEYRAGFTRSANPFKGLRDAAIWDKGYQEAQEQFTRMLARWKEMDRGTR